MLRRTFATLAALAVVCTAQADAPALIEKALFGGKLRISIPAQFKPMGADLLKQRYRARIRRVSST